ncbi:alpha/beta fold hydrolase [Amycolatopsis sp. NBC_00355]|uniref:alpha/beta fold hydrolase n=1 Tax=Amycolatopsis sp. NBC_00355 TaxID=2975957 RepID=UPI002E268814
MLALDLPGHGDSPRGSYAFDDVTDAIHGAVSSAGLTRPVLIGHLIGGVLATAYAARYPARAVVNLDQPLAGPFGALPGSGHFPHLSRPVAAIVSSVD